ncbi:MAG: NUDIX domain-containing protein [Rhodospirillales bacterium]|nr:MAG: NUDIX domain-containing protein [Rhodospirillales bacterium]
MTLGGYDGWSYREPNGGVVIVPFVMIRDEVFVGVVKQYRHNMGGAVLNAPRGFVDPGESPNAAAAREYHEETGANAEAVEELPGEAVNTNSAFVETPKRGDGVRFFKVSVQAGDVECIDGRFLLSPRMVSQSESAVSHRLAEQLERMEFIPWYDAARVADMFTVAGVARLLASLGPIAAASHVERGV